MSDDLERYLNDHLAGASGAVLLIQRLVDKVENPQKRDFLLDLKAKVEIDCQLLETLLEMISKSTGSISKAVGKFAQRVGSLKLMWQGMDPGELGVFEALELLALGIQGKRLLWRALHEVSGGIPQWSQIDFVRLEQEAVQQRDSVEQWRLVAARESLSPCGGVRQP